MTSGIMSEVAINGRWPMMLLNHRAARPEWPWWEAHTLALAHHLIEPGMVVWDVGSEEGDFPALFGTWGAEVVLIEPNPNVWPQIRIHWKANVERDPLACLVALASDVNDGATPDFDTGYDGVWPVVSEGKIMPEHGFRHLSEHRSVTPQIRLDNATLPAPDLITMDIEGGELHALRGMTATLATAHPIVLVSVHPAFMADLYGESAMDIRELMRGLGYEGRMICADHEEHWLYR